MAGAPRASGRASGDQRPLRELARDRRRGAPVAVPSPWSTASIGCGSTMPANLPPCQATSDRNNRGNQSVDRGRESDRNSRERVQCGRLNRCGSPIRRWPAWSVCRSWGLAMPVHSA